MSDLMIQQPVQLDLDELQFDLTANLDNLASLEMFEQQVFIANGDIDDGFRLVSDGYTRAAYHIHMILHHRLWRHRPNEYGQPMYESQDDYIKDLAQNLGKGFQPSTIKQFHTTIRMYRQIGWDREEIERAGITPLNKIAQRVDKDYATSAPKGLRHGKLPEGVSLPEYINQVTLEVLEAEGKPDVKLTGRELEVHLDQRLANRKPLIEFRRVYGSDMSKVQWVYELTDDVGQLTPSKYGVLHIQWQGDPPTSVIEKFFQKLGIDLS